jgi:hypothetical protein
MREQMKKTIVVFAFLLVFGLSLPAAIPDSERQVLIGLYNSTNGDNWVRKDNWKKNPTEFNDPGTENTWYGVTIGIVNWNETVTGIQLYSNNLAGTIPSELGSLSNLKDLDFWNNQLSGSIPPELGNLSNLQYLYLNSNQLMGSIPLSLSNLSNLDTLQLNDNQLTGSIPTEFGNLSNLFYLYLYNNQLSGSIPSQFGNLRNLCIVNLSSNVLSGPIPPELGNLSNLYILCLDYNQLSGSIPTSFGSLSNLKWLTLSNNQLSGTIPMELGNAFNLQYLYLNFNQLTGNIPAELDYLKNLKEFNLSGNMLSGAIPFDLTSMHNLDPNNTDIGYNALFAIDAKLINFLNHKDPDWAATQTIAPVGVSAASQNSTDVLVSWTPIPYTQDDGGYTVYISKTSGGPYFLIGETVNKSASSFLVIDLLLNTEYYFVVSTFTLPHGRNNNTVRSAYSDEVSITTPRAASAWKAGISYKVGDCVIYNGKTWRCTYAHTAQADWYPGAPGIWFWTLADYDGQWHAGISYKKGDVVQYLGKYWQCIFAHTAQSNWYPGAPGIWFWKKL